MTPLQVHRNQPGIDLRSLKLLVPQHPGDILHRSTMADKVGGEGVTQVVRGKATAPIPGRHPPGCLRQWSSRVPALRLTRLLLFSRYCSPRPMCKEVRSSLPKQGQPPCCGYRSPMQLLVRAHCPRRYGQFHLPECWRELRPTVLPVIMHPSPYDQANLIRTFLTTGRSAPVWCIGTQTLTE